MTKAEYIESLRSLLNEAAENGLSEISLQGTDTVSLNKLIEDSYRMAWDNLPLSARVSVDGATDIVPQLCEDDGPNSQVGYIELPSDYHTLVALKMDGWKNPVVIAYSRESEVGRLQGYTYARGNGARPVCIIEHSPSTEGWRLYYYSVPWGMAHLVKEFRYLKTPDINNPEMDVREGYIELMLLHHAMYIGIILNRDEVVKYFAELIKTKETL